VAGSGRSFDGAGLYYLNDKREHQRERSTGTRDAFNAVGDYALHDKDNRQTSHRVGFTAMLNMAADTPAQAIAQMSASYERYKEREGNKRGRKLTKPVYVYSLSWAPDETPSRHEMMSAAKSSLKALRLDGLQTLIVQHTDEPHPHIHIIVNRIELDGSRARNIPFDQLRFSRWAEQYERDHGGILCEQRVENNRLRSQGTFVKDTVSLSRAEYEARELDKLVAEKNFRRDFDLHLYAPNLEKDRLDLFHRHYVESLHLEEKAKARVAQDRAAAKAKFAPEWRKLYQRQAIQRRILQAANRGGIFERACFVFANRDFLAQGGRMGVLDITRFAFSSKALTKRVERVHQLERKSHGNWAARMAEAAVHIVWREYRQDHAILRARHQQENANLTYTQAIKRQHANAERQRRAEAGREHLPSPPQPAASEPSRPRPPPAQPAPPRPDLHKGHAVDPPDVGSFLKDPPSTRERFNRVADGIETPDEAIRREMEEYARRKRRDRDRDLGR